MTSLLNLRLEGTHDTLGISLPCAARDIRVGYTRSHPCQQKQGHRTPCQIMQRAHLPNRVFSIGHRSTSRAPSTLPPGNSMLPKHPMLHKHPTIWVINPLSDQGPCHAPMGNQLLPGPMRTFPLYGCHHPAWARWTRHSGRRLRQDMIFPY